MGARQAATAAHRRTGEFGAPNHYGANQLHQRCLLNLPFESQSLGLPAGARLRYFDFPTHFSDFEPIDITQWLSRFGDSITHGLFA